MKASMRRYTSRLVSRSPLSAWNSMRSVFSGEIRRMDNSGASANSIEMISPRPNPDPMACQEILASTLTGRISFNSTGR